MMDGETLDFNMPIGVPDTKQYLKQRRMGERATIPKVRNENRAQDVDISKVKPSSGPVKSTPLHM